MTDGKGEGKNVKLVDAVKSIRGILYTDDARVIARSPWILENTMSTIVRMVGRFGLPVPEDVHHVHTRSRGKGVLVRVPSY